MESNTRRILSDLYGLLMEINYHRSAEDVISELQEVPNARVERHYQNVRKLTAKYKAVANRQQFESALQQIIALKNRGIEELRKLIKPSEREELIPLFRKFEAITEQDEASIFEDQELLHLIEILKERANDTDA